MTTSLSGGTLFATPESVVRPQQSGGAMSGVDVSNGWRAHFALVAQFSIRRRQPAKYEWKIMVLPLVRRRSCAVTNLNPDS